MAAGALGRIGGQTGNAPRGTNFAVSVVMSVARKTTRTATVDAAGRAQFDAAVADF